MDNQQLLTLQSKEKYSQENKVSLSLLRPSDVIKKGATEVARGLITPISPVLFEWGLQFSAPERTAFSVPVSVLSGRNHRLICFETTGK